MAAQPASLLIVIGESLTEEHVPVILDRVTDGLSAWNYDARGFLDADKPQIDLNTELRNFCNANVASEQLESGGTVLRYAGGGVSVQVLVAPSMDGFRSSLSQLLKSGSPYKHVIQAGVAFAGSGSWLLTDGTFSMADLSALLHRADVKTALTDVTPDSTLVVSCFPEGEWNEKGVKRYGLDKLARVFVGELKGRWSVEACGPELQTYLGRWAKFTPLDELLPAQTVVGSVRFRRPTVHIFPAGEGDALLMGVDGFTLLLDGGTGRRTCYWDFLSHVDRVDALLVSRLSPTNSVGVGSFVSRLAADEQCHPKLGYCFGNLGGGQKKSPGQQGDLHPLLYCLVDQGKRISQNLEKMHIGPHSCSAGPDPLTLYQKVGQGKLDMYVLSPGKEAAKDEAPSMAVLLVWRPADPNEAIVRLLYPGSCSQEKVFAGLDKLKNLAFLKHSVCTTASLEGSAGRGAPVKKAPTKTSPVTASSPKPPAASSQPKQEQMPAPISRPNKHEPSPVAPSPNAAQLSPKARSPPKHEPSPVAAAAIPKAEPSPVAASPPEPLLPVSAPSPPEPEPPSPLAPSPPILCQQRAPLDPLLDLSSPAVHQPSHELYGGMGGPDLVPLGEHHQQSAGLGLAAEPSAPGPFEAAHIEPDVLQFSSDHLNDEPVSQHTEQEALVDFVGQEYDQDHHRSLNPDAPAFVPTQAASSPMVDPHTFGEMDAFNTFRSNGQHGLVLSPEAVSAPKRPAGFPPSSPDEQQQRAKVEDAMKEWGQPLGLPSPTATSAKPGQTAKSKAPPARGTTTTITGASASAAPKRPATATSAKPLAAATKSSAASANSTSTAAKKPAASPAAGGARPATATTKATPPAAAKPALSKAPPAAKAATRTTAAPTRAAPGAAKKAGPAPVPYYVDLTYVPIGSDEDLFKRLRARYYVLSSGRPSKETLDAALAGKRAWNVPDELVTLIPTQDSESMALWLGLRRDEMTADGLDLAPSCQRCTVNLEEHPGAKCAAYRLQL